MILRLVGVFTLALTTVFAEPAAAQETPFVLKIDLSAGLGNTFGGGKRDVSAASAFGVVVATPLRAYQRGTLVGGVALNHHLPLDFGTECTIDLPIVPGRGCRPHYPQFTSISALVGWEFIRNPKSSGARVLVGPATFRAEQRTHLGAQGRVDYTVMPPTSNVGLLVWGQGAMVSPFKNDPFAMLTAGVGIRIQ